MKAESDVVSWQSTQLLSHIPAGLFLQPKAGGELVCNDRSLAPSSPCDISLVR